MRSGMSKPGHWLCEWSEETSMFDPEGYWGGLEYKQRDYAFWVPDSITDDDEVQRFIDDHQDDEEYWADTT